VKVVYSETARRDVDSILETSERLFGESQAMAYAQLVARTIELIAEKPDRPSSRDLSNISCGLRALHMAIAAGGRRRASHQVVYRVNANGPNAPRVEIIRVLHQAMDTATQIELGITDLS
jgi:plasmid stabilization system protein ParE